MRVNVFLHFSVAWFECCIVAVMLLRPVFSVASFQRSGRGLERWRCEAAPRRRPDLSSGPELGLGQAGGR